MARERYLVGEGEESIHDNVIELRTAKDKTKNWWYYNKVKLLLGIIAVILVGSFVYSIVSKVQPDYTVSLMTSYTMPMDGMEQLKSRLEEYGDDRNGDGKVVVDLLNYVMSDSVANTDPTQLQASMVRFTAEASSNTSIIYLHDEAAFSFMMGNFAGFFEYTDGKTMPEDAMDFEKAMIPWADVKAFETMEIKEVKSEMMSQDVLAQLYERLRVSVRGAEGTSIEKKEASMQYYQDSKAFLERLKTGEKPEAK